MTTDLDKPPYGGQPNPKLFHSICIVKLSFDLPKVNVVGLPLFALAEGCVQFKLSTPSLLVVHALVSDIQQKLVLLSKH